MNSSKEIVIRELMQREDLGALIFWRPDELVMLLGYMPLWGLSFLVYTLGDAAVLYVPELEPEDILPAGIAVETYPWGILDCENPWEPLYERMQAKIAGCSLPHQPVSFIKAIGGTAPCRMSGEQPPLPVDLIDRFEKMSPAGYKDVSKELLKRYALKTPEDIAAIRRTHHIAKEAVRAFYGLARPGVAETEVANGVEAAVQRMIREDGTPFAKAWPLVQSGKNACAGGRYNRTSGKKLLEGEMVMMEMAICVDGYWADITRTAAVGKLSSGQEQQFHTVLGAQELALSMLRPGVEMAAVDAAARRHIAQAGWGHLYNHGLGHHVGFRYHDPGPTLSPLSTGILQEGMVLTIEPGIYGREIGGGIRIEDNVLITADGYELLSEYPRGLVF